MCMYIFSVDSLKLVIKKLSGQPIPPPPAGNPQRVDEMSTAGTVHSKTPHDKVYLWQRIKLQEFIKTFCTYIIIKHQKKR